MPVCVDIFSGAGGLSLGAELAGFDVRFAVEKDKNAARTYQRNHQRTRVICDDIHNVNPLESLLPEDDVFVVFGGPPCQGFSLSNTKTRNLSNPNNTLFEEFLRFVSVLNPHWFVFENVEGFVNFENGLVREHVKECFRNMGYVVSDRVLVASDYGVPQNRHRYFMVGNRHGITFTFPDKHDTKYTVEDAISDLPILDNGQKLNIGDYIKTVENCSEYAKIMRNGVTQPTQNWVSRNADYVLERYKYIHQGENWQAIPDELMQNYTDKSKCHSGIYKRLCADQPSVVISNYRKNMLIHPYQHRGLSVREAARLQSFPDSFIFEGTLMHIQQQIGNAVPPFLAKAVFEKILEYGEEF